MLAFIVGATTRLSAPKNPDLWMLINLFSARKPLVRRTLRAHPLRYRILLPLYSHLHQTSLAMQNRMRTHVRLLQSRTLDDSPKSRTNSCIPQILCNYRMPTLSHASPTSMQNQGPCRNETLAISRSADPLHRVVRLPKNSLRSPARRLRSGKRFLCASLRRLNR